MNGTKRVFNLGDEWLYVKIYSGPKILEKILIEDIYNLLNELYEENIINKFFFVRYFDEDYHLRLRFHLINNQTQFLIDKINKILSPYSESDIVWKISYDSYVRELERYGSNSIEDIETIFSYDSLIIMKALREINYGTEEFGEDTRWIYAIKILNHILECFEIDIDNQIIILESYSDAMISEFNLNKSDKLILNQVYREKRSLIENNQIGVLDSILFESKNNLNLKLCLEDLLKLKNQNKLEIDFNSLIKSILHMINNRIFRTNQRQNELYVYYLMSKQLKSQRARKNIICN